MGVTAALRARGYRLLGRALRSGLDGEVLAVLGRREGAPDDPEERAAAHHRLLRREVLPYASVFLEEERTLGGAVTREMEDRFRRAGLPLPEGEAPDHAGSELELLAALSERGDGAGVRALLDGHLLWWLPSFASALHRRAGEGDGPWREVATLALASAADQRAGLVPDEDGAAPPLRPPGPLAVDPTDPLEDPDAGLRDLARHLVTPVRAGLYLAPGDLREIGRRTGLPGGFGDRARLAETLLRSAARLEGLEPLAARLLEVVEDEIGALRAAVADHGLPDAFVVPWLRRLEVTRGALRRLAEAAPGPG